MRTQFEAQSNPEEFLRLPDDGACSLSNRWIGCPPPGEANAVSALDRYRLARGNRKLGPILECSVLSKVDAYENPGAREAGD